MPEGDGHLQDPDRPAVVEGDVGGQRGVDQGAAVAGQVPIPTADGTASFEQCGDEKKKKKIAVFIKG